MENKENQTLSAQDILTAILETVRDIQSNHSSIWKKECVNILVIVSCLARILPTSKRDIGQTVASLFPNDGKKELATFVPEIVRWIGHMGFLNLQKPHLSDEKTPALDEFRDEWPVLLFKKTNLGAFTEQAILSDMFHSFCEQDVTSLQNWLRHCIQMLSVSPPPRSQQSATKKLLKREEVRISFLVHVVQYCTVFGSRPLPSCFTKRYQTLVFAQLQEAFEILCTQNEPYYREYVLQSASGLLLFPGLLTKPVYNKLEAYHCSLFSNSIDDLVVFRKTADTEHVRYHTLMLALQFYVLFEKTKEPVQ